MKTTPDSHRRSQTRASRHVPLPLQQRADLLHQMAALERAGIAPLQALPMITMPEPWQQRLVATRRGMHRGQTIAQAGLHVGLWTPLEAGLLQAALAAGDPSNSYQQLADYYKEKSQQLAAMKSRLLLPTMMAVLSLMIHPLPQLITGSLSGGRYLWGIIWPLMLVASLLGLLRFGWQQWQMRPVDARPDAFDRLMLALPLFGRMHRRRTLCDYWQSLALLLEAGVPMFDALPLALHGAGNALLRQQLVCLLPTMQAGATLSQALQALPQIADPTLLGLVQSGEAAGSLPAMLGHYAKGENASLALQQAQLAQMLPRIVYALIAAAMAWSIIGGGAFMPQVPENL